ncbi:hypothetical protein OG203_26985 [Nocardia sp. NBC_01499]|uniref:hypothetical protein n=1 Tax=Nocardia sp. NBC_01499 TaxID=2903597 RepID=UPI00386B7B50
MTTLVTIDGYELSLTVTDGLLTVSSVSAAGPIPRGSLLLGELAPVAEPTYIEPDPVEHEDDVIGVRQMTGAS